MSSSSHDTAVILVNLGTPDAPTSSAVRRYLKEFLWDDRVIKRNPLWYLILNGIVLNTRPRKVAKLYESIWEDDSPIRTIGFKQRDLLQKELGEKAQVHLAMTYGNPSLKTCLKQLQKEKVQKIVILPLYPQYSATTTGAIYDQVADFIKSHRDLPEIHLIKDYHQHPAYISALANQVTEYWQQHGQAEKLLLSFHGIPKVYVTKGDPYEAQVKKSVELLAQKLNLEENQYQLCFQSRFGPTEWLQPYTDKTLEAWGKDGIESVNVICPAFSADCLETLEEIAEENKEIFEENGGKHYEYIPALNDRDDHIQMFKEIITPHLR